MIAAGSAEPLGRAVRLLRYEAVPQRAAVVRNGDLVELVIPSGAAWRSWAMRQVAVVLPMLRGVLLEERHGHSL